MRPAQIAVGERDGAARSGTVTTARGAFTTPCFMPVGTRGTVKMLTPADLGQLGVDVMLANTYHLMLRPGSATVEALGGLHRFTGWDGHLLTDSGGFQVFSLGPKVDDDGVTFRSTYDGTAHRLTPEGAVAVQEQLGADIQMVLDVCPALPAPQAVVRLAVERTAAWAARARDAHRSETQSLFGIVQGGSDPDLRRESARRTVEIGFDGYGIGGLSVGEPRTRMLEALAATVPELPDDRPRYLMGVGDPIGIVEAIALGVDMFDCVLPTRLGRHGNALTWGGRLSVGAAANARDDGPLDDACGCPTCQNHSRGFLRHLHKLREPTAARLVTVHNLAWVMQLVSDARRAIASGTLQAVRDRVRAAWEPDESDNGAGATVN